MDDGIRTARWESFDKPEMLRKGTATIWFEYGAGHKRVRRRQGNFNTWYLSGGPDVKIERLTHNNNTNVTTKYHYLVDGRVVGIDEDTNGGTPTSRYLHSDRLGSASVTTDSSGNVIERMSYDVWGQVQSLTQGSESTVLKSLYHTKSYTGHEALADVGLVHMNGRIYDPILGRFLSADPIVQYASNSQSYNRYSYVLNNPLGATDPSGYTGESVDGQTGGGFFSDTWSTMKSYLSGGSSGAASSSIGQSEGSAVSPATEANIESHSDNIQDESIGTEEVSSQFTSEDLHYGNDIEKVLEQLRSTKEFIELERIAKIRVGEIEYKPVSGRTKTEDGWIVNLPWGDKEITVFVPRGSSNLTYTSLDGAERLSPQRIIFHELHHKALTYSAFQDHVETIDPTNSFMEKYYDQPPRISENLCSRGNCEGPFNTRAKE